MRLFNTIVTIGASAALASCFAATACADENTYDSQINGGLSYSASAVDADGVQNVVETAKFFVAAEMARPTVYGDGVRQTFNGNAYELGQSYELYSYENGSLKLGSDCTWYPVYEDGKPVAILCMASESADPDADGNYSFLYILKDGSEEAKALSSGKSLVRIHSDRGTWLVDSGGTSFFVGEGEPTDMGKDVLDAIMSTISFSAEERTPIKFESGWQITSKGWVLFEVEYDPEVDPAPADDPDPAPALKTGWQKVDGKWYYMGNDGIMRTGWQKVDGKWYYMAKSGAMTTGWQKVGGKWYYMAKSGAMTTGWQKVDGKWYYMAKSGAMVTGKITIEGVIRNFDSSGAWIK